MVPYKELCTQKKYSDAKIASAVSCSVAKENYFAPKSWPIQSLDHFGHNNKYSCVTNRAQLCAFLSKNIQHGVLISCSCEIFIVVKSPSLWNYYWNIFQIQLVSPWNNFIFELFQNRTKLVSSGLIFQIHSQNLFFVKISCSQTQTFYFVKAKAAFVFAV